MNIYVGNLSLETTEDDLRQAFAAFGQVRSVNIVRDRDGGESRGFGFVTMPSKSEAQTAIDEMNGKDLKGQAIKTEEGRMKTNLAAGGRKRPGFGGHRGGGGRRGGLGGGGRGGVRRGGSGGGGRGGRRY
ncbi:MAG: RNA recognition motif domain-containing protein [Planctomycetota bacterium]|jgi:RNA recognition motif-containing protein